jgi:hypothetical protein
VLKLAVWLSGIVDFETATEILQQVGQIDISVSSVWRQVQRWGEPFKQHEEQARQRANALCGRSSLWRRANRSKGRMGVAVDGSMIHIRDEGWKELKIGCVFDVRMGLVQDPETGDWVERARAVNNSYGAHLGGPEVLGQLIWAEARRRDWELALDTQMMGDGAPWIWNVMQDHFYDSQPLVDWSHAVEHLAAAARLLKGENTRAAKRWFNDRETYLYQGHAAAIARELSKAAEKQPGVKEELRKQAGYFHNNRRRMNYQAMRESGWVIGSGMVESAAKQFKARFTGPGMRWSRAGAERLIPVRAAIMSHRFDHCWQRAYNSPLN